MSTNGGAQLRHIASTRLPQVEAILQERRSRRSDSSKTSARDIDGVPSLESGRVQVSKESRVLDVTIIQSVVGRRRIVKLRNGVALKSFLVSSGRTIHVFEKRFRRWETMRRIEGAKCASDNLLPFTDAAVAGFTSDMVGSASEDHKGWLHYFSDGPIATSCPLLSHQSAVEACAFSSNGGVLFTAGADHRLCAWSTQDRSLKFTLRLAAPILSLCVVQPSSSTGDRIICGCSNGEVFIWDAETKSLLGEQEDNEGHSSGILDISCHPQMLAIVTASSDGTAKVWNASGPLRRGPLTSSTSIHRTPVSGRRSRPGTQERISIAEERLAKQSKTNTNNNDELNGIDIPLDNKSVPTLAFTLSHEEAVRSASFSQDCVLVFTASADTTVRIWSYRLGSCLFQINLPLPAVGVCEVAVDEIAIAVGRRILLVKVKRSPELVGSLSAARRTSRELQQGDGQDGTVPPTTAAATAASSAESSENYKILSEQRVNGRNWPSFILRERAKLQQLGIDKQTLPRLLARGLVSLGALAALLGRAAGLSMDIVRSEIIDRAHKFNIPMSHILRCLLHSELSIADGVRLIASNSDAAFRLILGGGGDIAFLKNIPSVPSLTLQSDQNEHSTDEKQSLLLSRTPRNASSTYPVRAMPTPAELDALFPFRYSFVPPLESEPQPSRKMSPRRRKQLHRDLPSVQRRKEGRKASPSDQSEEGHSATLLGISSLSLSSRKDDKKKRGWPTSTASLNAGPPRGDRKDRSRRSISERTSAERELGNDTDKNGEIVDVDGKSARGENYNNAHPAAEDRKGDEVISSLDVDFAITNADIDDGEEVDTVSSKANIVTFQSLTVSSNISPLLITAIQPTMRARRASESQVMGPRKAVEGEEFI